MRLFVCLHEVHEDLNAICFSTRLGTDEDYEEKVGMLQTIFDLRCDAEQAKADEAQQRDLMKRKMSTLNEDGRDLRLQAVHKKLGKKICRRSNAQIVSVREALLAYSIAI